MKEENQMLREQDVIRNELLARYEKRNDDMTKEVSLLVCANAIITVIQSSVRERERNGNDNLLWVDLVSLLGVCDDDDGLFAYGFGVFFGVAQLEFYKEHNNELIKRMDEFETSCIMDAENISVNEPTQVVY